jgi:hypothetical protein
MMGRLIILAVAAMVASSAGAQGNQEYYRRNGTSMPSAIGSDPSLPPYRDRNGYIGMGPGATTNMSREGRRGYEARVQDELKERERRAEEKKQPPIKLDIAPRETPMPPLPSRAAAPIK